MGGFKTITKSEVNKVLGALFVYESGYCEYRDIIGERFGVVKPITKNVVRNIVKGLDESGKELYFRGTVPDNLVYFRSSPILHLMWTVPEGVHELEFLEKSFNGSYAFPKVMLRLYGNQLYAYGFKEYKKGSTELYSLKLPNVDVLGAMCMGSAKIDVTKFRTYEDVMDKGFLSFFKSKFSSVMNKKSMAKMKNKKFFDHKLLTHKINTVDGILRSTP